MTHPSVHPPMREHPHPKIVHKRLSDQVNRISWPENHIRPDTVDGSVNASASDVADRSGGFLHPAVGCAGVGWLRVSPAQVREGVGDGCHGE